MKRALILPLLVVFSVALPSSARAQSDGMKGMDMKGMDMTKNAKTAVHKGAGTVQKVDLKDGTVTIAHGPVKSMNWSAMTMSFTAKDKKKLEGIKPGDKVEFEFVQQGSKYAIISIK